MQANLHVLFGSGEKLEIISKVYLSISVAYATLGYQTGWLKCYYPVEFMAALLTSALDVNTNKIVEYIYECKSMSIQVLPPDINEGFENFTVIGKNIRFALMAIKNVGKQTIKSLVREREQNGKFTSLTNFINRMESKEINKRCIESMIKAGVFDSLGGLRIQYMMMYRQILEGVNTSKRKNLEGQLSLFSITRDNNFEIDKDILPDIQEYPIREVLSMEKEVLGIYLSGHPLFEYNEEIKNYSTISSMDLISDEIGINLNNRDVIIGGIVVSITINYTKTNNTMAFLIIEDLYGRIEVIVFPKIYKQYNQKLFEDSIIFVKGKITSKEEETPKIIANKITFINEIVLGNNKTLWIKISKSVLADFFELTDILLLYPGNTPVIIYDEVNNQKFRADSKYYVNLNDELITILKEKLGQNCIVIKENII